MKKFVLGLFMVTLTVVMAACGGNDEAGGEAKEGETYDLDMSVTVGEASTWYKAAEKLAEDVKEKSEGRINISVYPNEQLSGGNSGTAVEQVANGTQAMSYNSTIIYSIMDERLGVLSAPFIFPDLDTAYSLLDGEGGEMIKDILRENGVEPLGFGQNGFRQVTNSEHPIKTPEDLKGLKMRIPGIAMYTDLWRMFGTDPTSMTFSEVFTALQQGTTGGNIGRMAALAGGLPASVSGMSIDRQCSSGMMAIATAAKQIQSDGMDVVIGGGVESISLVQK